MKQGQSGLGLDAQKAAVANYLSNAGSDSLEEYTEIESGKSSRRPVLARVLRHCKLTGATLVIAKLDRLSRDIEFIANLQKSKVLFTCCDMPEANTMTIGMMAVMAQYERELISQRTKDGLKAAKARGVVLGNPRLDECRNTDTTNARAARVQLAADHNLMVGEIIDELESDAGGELPATDLANLLNDAGYRTRRGCEFSRIQVYRAKAAIAGMEKRQ